MPERFVTRGEFLMMAQQVTDNAHRIDTLDSTGTRGVSAVQSQLVELSKDVAALNVRIDKHDETHNKEERDRRTTRRWVITVTIAFMAAIEGPLIYLIQRK